MAWISILKSTPTWLPFFATNVTTGDQRLGIQESQVDVSYKKYGEAVFNVKVLAPSEFRENGNGVYEILFSAFDTNTEGTFLYIVAGNGALPAPAIRQFFGQAAVMSAQNYVPGAITLDTNALTGNLIDLSGNPIVGASVSARILAAPSILGTSPNIGGVGIDIVGARTDTGGFFALEVIQGSQIDVIIPMINYRRTLTVPYNNTDSLFTLP